MDISIVIPALNEATKIHKDIVAAAAYIHDRGMAGEVIVVDDGSSDDTAGEARATEVPQGVVLKVIRLEQNRGKGCAVRNGIAASVGDFVLFADSGLCISFDTVDTPLKWLRGGECQIAHASRILKGSVITRQRPLSRRILSAVFRKLAKLVARIPRQLTDSQCGFKLYQGDIGRSLYRECLTDGFLFDVEVVLRAARKNLTIREFPIVWTSDPDTRLAKSRGLQMLWSLVKIRRMMSGR